MKLTAITILLLVALSALRAQPVITAANFSPIPGDRTISMPCDTTGITDGGGGANRIWDFSMLHVQPFPDTVFYSDCVDTHFCSFFPECNLVKYYFRPPPHDPRYEYYSSTSDSLVQLGTATPDFAGAAFPWTCPIQEMHYPFGFGTSFTNSIYETIFDTTTEYDTFNCDGYGKLILPGGIYDSTLRLHICSVYYDTEVSMQWPYLKSITKIDSFAWLTPGVHHPLLGLIFAKTVNAMGTFTNKRVTINNCYSVASIFDFYKPIEVKISPNPSSGKFRVDFSLLRPSYVDIVIVDVLGAPVGRWQSHEALEGSQEILFDILSIPPGMYFVEVRCAGQSIVKKIEID